MHANFDLSSRCLRCEFVPQGNDLSNNIERSVPELGNLLNGHGMKIVHQNICGLELHKSNFEEIIASYRGIDLTGLSETHMNTNISSDEVYLDGYNLKRLDRGCGKGGGVAVYIISCLTAEEMILSAKTSNVLGLKFCYQNQEVS